MIDKSLNNFNINNIGYELFFSPEGFIEIYETDDPSKTGFIFDSRKDFIMFVNTITDVLERKISMEEKK